MMSLLRCSLPMAILMSSPSFAELVVQHVQENGVVSFSDSRHPNVTEYSEFQQDPATLIGTVVAPSFKAMGRKGYLGKITHAYWSLSADRHNRIVPQGHGYRSEKSRFGVVKSHSSRHTTSRGGRSKHIASRGRASKHNVSRGQVSKYLK